MWSARAKLKRNTAQLAGSNSASSNAILARLRIRYVHRPRTPAVPPKIDAVHGPRGLLQPHRLDAKFVEFRLQISGLFHRLATHVHFGRHC